MIIKAKNHLHPRKEGERKGRCSNMLVPELEKFSDKVKVSKQFHRYCKITGEHPAFKDLLGLITGVLAAKCTIYIKNS